MTHKTKCGYIAVVGKPNVGKSTLMNTLLKNKISITSKKPQTTRYQVTGIKTVDDTQFVFVDTPGLHETSAKAMNRYMNRAARASLVDVDVILWLVEANSLTPEDEYVLSLLEPLKVPIFLVLTKADKIADKTTLLPFIEKMQGKLNFHKIIPISALKDENLDPLLSAVSTLLPEAPFFFDKDQKTDKNPRFLISEIIREKLIRNTGQELPYSLTVSIEDWAVKKAINHLSVVIWVERAGQKAIVIGKGGDKLKTIGTQARKDIEKLLEAKVFLRLWVKVKEGWSNDDKLLNELGYHD